MSSFQEGRAQGEKLGGMIFIFFRIAWFFLRIAWWLSQFLIFSLFAGIFALVKLGRPKPDITTGFGHFSEDGTRWQDQHTGQWYPISEEIREHCVIEASMGGLAWRRNALSRLVKRGAIYRYTFAAVSDANAGRAVEPFDQEEFLNEARHNITLDHLDPEYAANDPYNLSQNRDEAVSALDHLEGLLTNRGWEREDDPSPSHWYARKYGRRICWDEPIPAEAATAEATADAPITDGSPATT
ncbi:MAG: hypothetical protein ACRDPY_00665 [Streptosporangiaceae bacterium]